MQTRALPRFIKMQTNLVCQSCRQGLSAVDKCCLSWTWRCRRRSRPTADADGGCRRQQLCTLDSQIRGCKCTTLAAQAVSVLDRVGLAWRRQHPIRGCDRRLAWAGSAGCGHAVKCWPSGVLLCFIKQRRITSPPPPPDLHAPRLIDQ